MCEQEQLIESKLLRGDVIWPDLCSADLQDTGQLKLGPLQTLTFFTGGRQDL